MKPLRYTERYWPQQRLDRAKFEAAAICRWLNKSDPYKPNVTVTMRGRLIRRTLPKRK